MVWLLGCGIVSIATFFLLWVGFSLRQAMMILSIGGLSWGLLTYGRFILINNAISPKPSPTLGRGRRYLDRTSLHGGETEGSVFRLIFGLIIILQLSVTCFAALVSPLTDWDAWVNWAGKANLIFIEQTISTHVINNPARLPTNMDYPLLIPLIEAWGYGWIGQIYEPGAGIISFLFYGALLLLFYEAVHQFASPTAALGFTTLLATAPRLERAAISGLADIPLAAFVIFTFLLMAEFNGTKPDNLPPHLYPLPRWERGRVRGIFKKKDPGHLRLTLLLGVTVGFIPWLKNEGWIWAGLATAMWLGGVVVGVQTKRYSGQSALIMSGIYLLALGMMALPWQVFLSNQGTMRFTYLPLTPQTFWENGHRLPFIIGEMAKRLLNPYWNFIWLFTSTVFVVRGWYVIRSRPGIWSKLRRLPYNSWLIIPVIGYLGIIGFTYVFSRFTPYQAHLNNSVERLMLQALPLVLWWLAGQWSLLGEAE